MASTRNHPPSCGNDWDGIYVGRRKGDATIKLHATKAYSNWHRSNRSGREKVELDAS
jgi:hypothetical protein